MPPRDVARALNIGRIALGTCLVLAPRRTARAWLGRDADRPGTAVVARAHGVRDAVVGAIALHTLDSEQVGPRCQRVLAICDAVDFGATLAARRQLPRSASLVAALAAAGVAGQLWVAGRLGSAEPAAGG
ncbi:MAG TPA: hypothetical protein VM299_01865 [Solirubrobacteraceae bacterium]|nr:hypothetical protein [Solirubrobacteraceae bacterium]